MSESNSNDDIIRKAEKARIDAETEKFITEKRKIDLEISEKQKSLNKPWYRREKTIQAFVAGIVSFPILWFFFSEIIEPSYQRENIQLSLENKRQELRLEAQKDSLRSLKAEFESRQTVAEQERKAAWDELEAMKKRNKDLLALNEKLLEENKAAAVISNNEANTTMYQQMEADIASIKSTAVEAAYQPNTGMSISDNLLRGKAVEHYETSKTSGNFSRPYPDAVVFHYTAGNGLESAIKSVMDEKIKQSVHVIIGRDGKVAQLLPFDAIAWHTGRSEYDGRRNYNNYAIGIQLVNAGKLALENGECRAWYGKTIPKEDVGEAQWPNPKQTTYWQKYTPIQLERAEQILELITENYNIREILGHHEISEGRKLDPGPLFPLDEMRADLLLADR